MANIIFSQSLKQHGLAHVAERGYPDRHSFYLFAICGFTKHVAGMNHGQAGRFRMY